MEPVTRLEILLDAIANDAGVTDIIAVTRIEKYLTDILDGRVSTIEPKTRLEQYLYVISGGNMNVPEPKMRIEMFLAKISGMEIEPPEPVTRLEMFLSDWANNSGSEDVTVSGNAPLALADALAKNIKKLTQFGLCQQSTTPTPSAPVDIVCNNGALKWDSVNQRVYADGTDEVLTVIQNQNTDPTIVKATLASADTDVRYNITSSCIVAPVKPNTTYTVGFLTKPTGGAIFRAATTKTKVTSSQTSVASIAYDLDKNDYEPKTLNSGEDAAWMYVQLSNTMTDEDFASILIQEGTSLTPPQTASVENLFAVGDYADEQDLISGGVTRRIGCHVFDGTETLSKSNAYGKAFLLNAAYAAWGADKTKAVLCTHFLGLPQKSSAQDDNTCFFNSTGHFYFRVTDNSDTDAFKAWLAEQYASGSPVIVFFVLAEETTEQTTAHALHTTQGENVVSVTANVSPVSLEVEYEKKKS